MPTPSESFHGCFSQTIAEGKFTGDASKFFDFSSSEWKQVKSRDRGKFGDKKISIRNKVGKLFQTPTR
jgi:hypothetical protein